jgi:phage terminase Nu1 subunit (DNA packaging protein)
MARDDLTGKPSLSALARITGLGLPRLSQINGSKPLTGATLGDWLKEFTRRLSDHAAGRAGGLADERARLAAAQAERVEMENDVTRGTLAPRELLELAAARFARQVVKVLESIPIHVKRKSSGVTPKALAVIVEEINRARSLAAGLTLEDTSADEKDDDEAD